MNVSQTRAKTRLAPTLAALACSLLAAACGGGGDDPAIGVAQTPAPATAPRSVAVQGCVVDGHHIPVTGTPVRVLAADGRLLGNALSDGQGRFTLRLPAQGDVLLQVDRPQGESLPMRVDAQTATWEPCLLDDERA